MYASTSILLRDYLDHSLSTFRDDFYDGAKCTRLVVYVLMNEHRSPILTTYVISCCSLSACPSYVDVSALQSLLNIIASDIRAITQVRYEHLVHVLVHHRVGRLCCTSDITRRANHRDDGAAALHAQTVSQIKQSIICLEWLISVPFITAVKTPGLRKTSYVIPPPLFRNSDHTKATCKHSTTLDDCPGTTNMETGLVFHGI